MNKTQIGLVVSGVLIAVVLFQFPKFIVKNESTAEISTEEKDSKSGAADAQMQEAHRISVSDSDQENLKNLTNLFFSFSDKEKKLTFADSIAAYYKSLHLYDSAARFYELKAGIEPSFKNFVLAGDAYYEAYTVSSENKRNQLAEKTRMLYDEALEIDPGNGDIKAKKAMTLISGENPMQGIQLLREVIEKDPYNALALYNLGILSIQSGQYDKAIERFKTLTKQYPDHASGYFYLGLSYLSLDKKEEAKKAFERAKSLDDDPAFQASLETYLKDTE